MSERNNKGKVVILDRDGTIVVDRGYLSEPDGLEFLPGAAEGLRWFHDNGYRLVIITNQSGLVRGMFTVKKLGEIHHRLRAMMRAIGAPVEAIYFCPHLPEANCECRKPNTGLLLRAAADLQFDPADAIVIGDKPSDVELGRRVGARTVWISPEFVEPEGDVRPNFIAENLWAATRAIQARAMSAQPAGFEERA